jgi:hypothetical protein
MDSELVESVRSDIVRFTQGIVDTEGICDSTTMAAAIKRAADYWEARAAEPVVCPLCNEPIKPDDKTDEGEYGVCHHNCQDYGD